MLYLLGGFAVLSGFLLLVYLFVNADPARLARGLKVTGIVIAVVAVATLAISGRLAVLLMPLAMLMPLLIPVRSYLDRVRPDWRDELAGAGASAGTGGGAKSAAGDMTIEEAYAILGLSSGADDEAIKEAHRRLMVKLHPDHGGSDYLATKINRARDVLLHK